MYKCYFGIIICFFQHLIIAQQSDSLAKSKTQNIIRFLENKYFGWTAFTGFDGAPALGNLKKQMRLDVALTHQRVSLGMTYTFLIDELKQYVIFPKMYRLRAQQGGIIMGIRAFHSKWINGYFKTAFLWGQMIWEDPPTKEHAFASKSECFKPEFEITIAPKFWLQLSAKLGYQKILNVNLPSLNSNGFSGIFYSLGLKINLNNEKY